MMHSGGFTVQEIVATCDWHCGRFKQQCGGSLSAALSITILHGNPLTPDLDSRGIENADDGYVHQT